MNCRWGKWLLINKVMALSTNPNQSLSLRSVQMHGGFTLVEMLTSIAIIGILAGILFTAVGSAQESARVSSELSDVRQLALGTLMYAATNDQKIFEEGTPWVDQLAPEYVPIDGDFFLSPFDEREGTDLLSYAINYNAVHLRFTQTDKQQDLYLFAPSISPKGAFTGTLGEDLYFRHDQMPGRGSSGGGEYMSVSFGDGHVERVPFDDFISPADVKHWFMCDGNNCIFKPPPGSKK